MTRPVTSAPSTSRTGWICVLVAVLLVGAACSDYGAKQALQSGYTPGDPPPIPDRKPQTPAGFLAQSLTAKSLPAADGVAAGAAITREALAPVGVSSTYRVQAGDTVYAVARRFRLPIRAIIDANDLAPPYVLKVGWTMDIPAPRLHQVNAGDTVYGISRRYGVDMAALVRLNGIDAPYNIVLNQQLIIPGPAMNGAPAGRDAPAGIEVAALPGSAGDTAVQSAPSTAPASPGTRPTLAETVPIPKAPAKTPATTTSTVASAKPAQPQMAAIPTPPPRKGGKFLWPVDGALLLGYGPKPGGLHNDGINIAASRGTPIRAAENGVVAYAGNELRGFGNLVLIKHSGGWVTAYAHADVLTVARGDTVERGQIIGQVGSTGNVSKPQLHFEVRKGTRAVDPARLLGPRMTAAAN